MSKVINLENGVDTLTFNDLALTIDEESVGSSPIHEMKHVELLENIMDIFHKTHHDYQINDIVISDGGEKKAPGLSYYPIVDKDKTKDVSAHVVRRLITSFDLFKGQDDISNTKLALSYSQNGIVAAIGANVKICSNLSIFGYENIVSTKGRNKVDNIQSFLDVIRGWFQRFDEMRMRDQKIIDNMSRFIVGKETITEMIGDLHIKRILKDDFREVSIYPFNQGSINDITRELIKDQQIYAKNNPESDYETTLWDLYNIGTALHKPDRVDIPNIIVQNAEWGQYLVDKFRLEQLN